jgi:hypothetical protein
MVKRERIKKESNHGRKIIGFGNTKGNQLCCLEPAVMTTFSMAKKNTDSLFRF